MLRSYTAVVQHAQWVYGSASSMQNVIFKMQTVVCMVLRSDGFGLKEHFGRANNISYSSRSPILRGGWVTQNTVDYNQLATYCTMSEIMYTRYLVYCIETTA